MSIITKKSPTTTAANSGTSYLSMMTSNVVNNNNTNIKRRETSIGEDSTTQINHDTTGKTFRLTVTGGTNLASSLSTTAPNQHKESDSTTMVASSTLIPPTTTDAKPSSSIHKDSNTSRTSTNDDNSGDRSSNINNTSHYLIKCDVNQKSSTPRVKVTVQQPSITVRSGRLDSSPEKISPSPQHLQTPISNTLTLMTTSTTSSAPEFSISGASSIEDSDELTFYDQYVSHGRQSNPSPELRKKAFDDWTKREQRLLPRSKSDLNTPVSEETDQKRTTYQIKAESTSYGSEDDDSNNRLSTSNNSSDINKKKKSKAVTLAKDFKSRAANLIRRRTTEATLSEKSLIPSREEVQSWEQSFDALLRHRYGQALFRAFLRTEFSEENLEFWLACDEFRSCKEPKRSTKAKKIYMDFIAIGSPKQINLDTETRMATIANIDNPPIDTFDRAQRRIQGLMEKDSYQRFLKSELYINLLRRAPYPVQRRTTTELTSKTS